MVRTLWQDLRYGARMLRQHPGFSAVAVLSLALGIGANTSIFSFVNAVLLKPLPVAEPARLVYVFSGRPDTPYNVASYPDYVDLRDKNQGFSSLAAYSAVSVSFNDDDQPETISGLIVSGNYFDTLGVRPALGRSFLPEEDKTPGSGAVVVISHALWQSRFGADAGVIGRKLLINGQPFSVVGVAPAGFNGAETGRTNDFYVPLAMQALVRPPRGGYSGEMNPDLLSKRGPRWLSMIGRLKPGVTAQQAQAEMSALAAQLARAYPDTNKDVISYV
jgi:predicted permease